MSDRERDRERERSNFLLRLGLTHQKRRRVSPCSGLDRPREAQREGEREGERKGERLT